MDSHAKLVAQLREQNRLLRLALALISVCFGASVLMAAKAADDKTKFTEIDVERINVVTPEGKTEMVIANRNRLPAPVIDGKAVETGRTMPGILFYNANGDENGGLVFDGKLDANGKPNAGMHFSMDRFGGDQQLALGHYEQNGYMETGLHVYDRGLNREYEPLFQAMKSAPEGEQKAALRKQWLEAGGRQTPRVFVGKTKGRSSAVILADPEGRPRIMMLVSPEGQPVLNFLDENGKVIQALPELGVVKK